MYVGRSPPAQQEGYAQRTSKIVLVDSVDREWSADYAARMSSPVEPLTQLRLLLAPNGIKTFTTGSDEASRYLIKRYGSIEEAEARFHEELALIPEMKVAIVGVPNDNGAGFERGSKKGPMALRAHWAEQGLLEEWRAEDILDIGDVLDHPLLTHDSLLNSATIRKVREARWGEEGERIDLPVSALSIQERVLECLYELNPTLRLLTVGGDHSKSLAPSLAAARRQANLGILQFDAHTDLLEERDGLPHSYATWSWHANEALGRGERMVQIGVRTSGKSADQWLKELEVKQYWADKVRTTVPGEFAQELISHFQRVGVEKLYLSVDIDALSPEEAAATGTVERDGLSLLFVNEVIDLVSEAIPIIGADMMEVAPPLSRGWEGEPERTIRSATAIVEREIAALLQSERCKS